MRAEERPDDNDPRVLLPPAPEKYMTPPERGRAEDKRTRLARLLADLYGTRIADITEDDMNVFDRNLHKHGFVLIATEAIVSG